MEPVATTSDVGLPDIEPNKADDRTENLAVAPLDLPAKRLETLKKKFVLSLIPHQRM